MSNAPQTPAVNPAVPGDPRTLDGTPAPNENYDVVINGQGYMMWRAIDVEALTYYGIQPIMDTYSPVFIERVNTQGDLGDNTQDFYMTFVQRSWTGGEGQKYFRQQPDAEVAYWDGQQIQPTMLPGSVQIGPSTSNQALTAAARAVNVAYVKETGAGDLGDALMKIEALAANSAVFYESQDGGATWTTMPGPNGNAPKMTNVADIVCGDDGWVYFLDAANKNSAGTLTGPSESNVYRLSAVSLSTTWNVVSWSNHLATTLDCLEYFKGGLYGANNGGQLLLINANSGSTGSTTVINDLGGGTIVDLVVGPGILYILYVAAQGDYRIYGYDGQTMTELARLPRGWKMNDYTEHVGADTAHIWSSDAMVYQDGVLYVSGVTPARDYVQSAANTLPWRTALWFYSAGNTGLIWEGNVAGSSPVGSAICSIDGGRIVFADTLGQRLMCYDPSTGAIFGLGKINLPVSAATCPPLVRLEYDFLNHCILGVWCKDQAGSDTRHGFTMASANVVTRWKLRGSAASGAYLTTSAFDFNSSLPKLFRDVMIDGSVSIYAGNTGTFTASYILNSVDTGSEVPINSGNPMTPGTYYPINVQGRSISVKVYLNKGVSDVVGPELTRIAVRGVPLQPTFRRRMYALALFNEVKLKDGTYESSTPSALRVALETAMTSQAPILVSDDTMTGTSCVFENDACKVIEMRPSEYVAIVSLRET